MKISVIMSVYNNEDTVENSIKSILNQTFSEFEFLICDDNSSDRTYEKIKAISKLDSRVIPLQNSSNIGLTKTLNKLVEYSKYDIIARQDGDDFSNESRFQTQVKYLKNQYYDFVITRAVKIQENRLIPRGTYYLPSKLVLNFKNPFIHGTLLIRKSALLAVGKYDENFYYAQDYKLYVDLIKNGYKFKKLFKPLYNLNTINNISSYYSREQKYYAECVRKKRLPNHIY